jgi:hypothetical protein
VSTVVVGGGDIVVVGVWALVVAALANIAAPASAIAASVILFICLSSRGGMNHLPDLAKSEHTVSDSANGSYASAIAYWGYRGIACYINGIPTRRVLILEAGP